MSLSIMGFLWKEKKKVAKALDSMALEKDADCTLAYIKLSGVLLAGSLIYLVQPELWWVDAISRLLLAVLIFKEGRETLRVTHQSNFSGGCGCSH